jgi:hypothetical protein
MPPKKKPVEKTPLSERMADRLNMEPGEAQEFIDADQDVQMKVFRGLENKNAKLRAQLKTEKAKREQAEHELESAEGRVDHMLATQDIVPAGELGTIKKHRGGEATAILCLSDWHAEETVDANSVNGLNEFNIDIADERIKRVFEKALYLLEFARNISTIKDLVVWLGGDLITGYIHDELVESNSLSPSEACLFVQDRVVTGIDHLKNHANVKGVTVVTNHGNHGRTTVKKRISTSHKNSYEWLMYNNLARMYRKDPLVKWKIAEGYLNYLDIQGHTVRFHHGDGMRYQGGVGGITVPVNKAIAQYDKQRRAAFDVFGHYHQFMENWRWICNGAIVGYNAYALEIKADIQPPTQSFIVVDKEYGKVMALPIFVDEPL